jgi:uracil-DNA glycosylase family 4
MTNDLWNKHDGEVISCRKCPRLVEWREQVGREKRRAFQDWDYWSKPVPGFGDRNARVLVIGLAPGAHGSNRTGRMFTGDASGDFLYPALFEAGFATQPQAEFRDDGLQLRDMYITALCRCVPPQNKPNRDEVLQCQPYLLKEIDMLSNVKVIVALGRLAFDQVIRIYRDIGYPVPKLAFSHAVSYPLGDGLPKLLASYHPSRQNTQTGKLTKEMFAQVWQISKRLSQE